MPITRSQACVIYTPPPQNPAELGRDLLSLILSHLSADDLLNCALVSKDWRHAANHEAIWERLSKVAWEKLVYNPAVKRTELSWKRRFLFAQADEQRTLLTKEELCAFRWTFYFKRQAGEWWMALDPYYTGVGPLMQRLYQPDGSITAPPGDPLFGEHEIRWRFTKSKEKVKGHYVKVNHWPSLEISRTEDGGWRMQNMWVVHEALLRPHGPYRHGVAGLERHLA